MTKQLSLFNLPSLNVNRTLKEQMAKSNNESGLSREKILTRMNRLAERYGIRLIKGNGSALTMSSFEKWLNPKDREHLPALNTLVVFCAAIDDQEPMRVLTAPLGVELINENDIKSLHWDREDQAAKRARARMKKLEAEL
ncbi:MAG: hypothetical protein OEV64_11195 [Desulfobulbaceae bacterium]|nr:hypothetical protein [Desulfobulbaceae bacterium]